MKKNYLLNVLIIIVLGMSFYGCEGPIAPIDVDGVIW